MKLRVLARGVDGTIAVDEFDQAIGALADREELRKHISARYVVEGDRL